jgi:hypothetical protein
VPTSERNVRLDWSDGGMLELDGRQFAVTHDSHVDESTEAPDGAFILIKTREMVERFCARYAGFDAKHVFEIGMFRGGSTACS